MKRKDDEIAVLYHKVKALEDKNKLTSYEIVKFKTNTVGSKEELKYLKVRSSHPINPQKKYEQLNREYNQQEKEASNLTNELSQIKTMEDEVLLSVKIHNDLNCRLKKHLKQIWIVLMN